MMSHVRCQMSDVGCRMSDVGCRRADDKISDICPLTSVLRTGRDFALWAQVPRPALHQMTVEISKLTSHRRTALVGIGLMLAGVFLFSVNYARSTSRRHRSWCPTSTR